MIPKRLELLCELVPKATVIAMLVDPDNKTGNYLAVRYGQEAARARGIKLDVRTATTEAEIDAAFALQADGFIIGADVFFASRTDQLLTLAARYAVPVIYWIRSFVTAGGLISYGPDYHELSRQVGIYAGRILKGEKPADLPVQRPTAFYLIVNLKTAKELGLTIPQSILARADELIE